MSVLAIFPICRSASEKCKFISVDPYTGCLTSIKADGKERLKKAMSWNVLRYTDNDRELLPLWETKYRLPEVKPEIFSCKKTENGYVVKGI